MKPTLLNKEDLVMAGWPDGPEIEILLVAARIMEERGIRDTNYILKKLRRDFPPPDSKLRLRDHALPLSEAITATCRLDEQNIGAVRRQMGELLRVPVVTAGAIMPDACPAGNAPATIPVGGIVAAERAILPAAHSEDLCCSMRASFFRSHAPTKEIMDALQSCTRFGAGGRSPDEWVDHPVLREEVWNNPFLQGLERHAAMHLADQGDGNHFAWLGEIAFSRQQLATLSNVGHADLARALESGDGPWKVLVTHHGSRGLGAHVFKRGLKAAEKHTAKVAHAIPEAACWLDADSEEGRNYWEALQYVGRWTEANHQCIHEALVTKLACNAAASVWNAHNFVWRENDIYYHGKGATPAGIDPSGRPLLGLIPLNMAAPILLVIGRNNRRFLGFAPHGAGRNVSRRALIKPWRMKDGNLDADLIDSLVAGQTQGIDVRWWHGKADPTELPFAYKTPEQIKQQIRDFDLAEIFGEIQPLGCIMAGDPGPQPWTREKDLTPKQKRQIIHRADRRTQRQKIKDWEVEDPEISGY
jgi:tRNA-splicing ligase RtcB (3'-phosphate/5'-hydroxy nucleic acid ligase)